MPLDIASSPGSPQLPSGRVGCSHPPGYSHVCSHTCVCSRLTQPHAHVHTCICPHSHPSTWPASDSQGPVGVDTHLQRTHTCISSSSCVLSSSGSAAPPAFTHHASSLATKRHTSSLTLFRPLLGRHPDLVHMHKDQKAHSFLLHFLSFPWHLAPLGFGNQW